MGRWLAGVAVTGLFLLLGGLAVGVGNALAYPQALPEAGATARDDVRVATRPSPCTAAVNGGTLASTTRMPCQVANGFLVAGDEPGGALDITIWSRRVVEQKSQPEQALTVRLELLGGLPHTGPLEPRRPQPDGGAGAWAWASYQPDATPADSRPIRWEATNVGLGKLRVELTSVTRNAPGAPTPFEIHGIVHGVLYCRDCPENGPPRTVVLDVTF